jgi:hypothetical protein
MGAPNVAWCIQGDDGKEKKQDNTENYTIMQTFCKPPVQSFSMRGAWQDFLSRFGWSENSFDRGELARRAIQPICNFSAIQVNRTNVSGKSNLVSAMQFMKNWITLPMITALTSLAEKPAGNAPAKSAAANLGVWAHSAWAQSPGWPVLTVDS